MTRTLARQMSGPVPSPSMNGMPGRSGTTNLPAVMEIFWPAGGGVGFAVVGIVMVVRGSGGGENRVKMLAHAPGRPLRRCGALARERPKRHTAAPWGMLD